VGLFNIFAALPHKAGIKKTLDGAATVLLRVSTSRETIADAGIRCQGGKNGGEISAVFRSSAYPIRTDRISIMRKVNQKRRALILSNRIIPPFCGNITALGRNQPTTLDKSLAFSYPKTVGKELGLLAPSGF